MAHWRILSRHHYGKKILITESILDPDTRPVSTRRYTATIEGWRNWRLYEGHPYDGISNMLHKKAWDIRERILKGDESVFFEH